MESTHEKNIIKVVTCYSISRHFGLLPFRVSTSRTLTFQKICVICLTESPLEMMKNAHLKGSFGSQDV